MHEVLVCNPRRNALLKEGNKSDKDGCAQVGRLVAYPCYDRSTTEKTDYGRCASWRAAIRPSSKILIRVMNRLKALYRGWGIPCSGPEVYAPRYREEWLHKIPHAGVRRRAELLYQQMDGLQALRANPTPRVIGGEPET